MVPANISLEIFGIIITLMLLICCLLDRAGRNKSTRLFMSMLTVNIAVLACDLITWVFYGRADLVPALHIVNSFVYALGYVLTAIFNLYLTDYIKNNRRTARIVNRTVAAACILAILLVIVSYFNGMYFYYVDGKYVRGPLYWLSQAYPIGILVFDMIFILCSAKPLGLRDTLSLMSYGILPAIAMLIQIYVFGITLLYIATTLSLMIIYIAVYLAQSRRLQRQGMELQRQEMELQRQEMELQQSRISIMLSQIQPHFLYNALNTVDALCDVDTQKAQKALRSFAKYLRFNLDAISRKTPVPFREELAHVRQYLTLETFRFDNIRVEYDIEVLDFMLPALTLQPIVENAVKYGVLNRTGGVSITISTRDKKDYIQITAQDDGVGFDSSKKPEDGRSHIGIENVRRRVETMCGGTVTVDSMPGAGTIVTYILPKGRIAV